MNVQLPVVAWVFASGVSLQDGGHPHLPAHLLSIQASIHQGTPSKITDLIYSIYISENLSRFEFYLQIKFQGVVSRHMYIGLLLIWHEDIGLRNVLVGFTIFIVLYRFYIQRNNQRLLSIGKRIFKCGSAAYMRLHDQ